MNKFIILLAAVAMSCGNKMNDSSKDMAVEEKTEQQAEPVANTQKDMLIGYFEKNELQQAPFSKWFSPRYDEYTPDTEAMNTIAENINDYEIKLFMGTWCGDSKRETPKFLKILDEADFNYDNLEMVAVDYSKKTPTNIEDGLDVKRVPTIIFFKDGKEVNRFVEYSQGESIEQDIAKIVSGEAYKNSYAE